MRLSVLFQINSPLRFRIKYSTIETKEAARIGYSEFLFPREYSGDGLGWVRMRKKKPVISDTGNFFCLNNNVSNLYNNSVVEKTNGMTFNPNTTLKLIYWFIYHQWTIPLRSQAFSVRVTLQGIKSRSRAHPHYSHNNTKIDELENFSEDNKTGLTERVILFRVTERNETKRNDFVSSFSNYYRDITILRNEII